MKGLLLKDFLVLTKQMKLFLILIPVMAIAGGAPMASIAILIGAVLPMTAMAYDEQSKWNDLAVMMPYSRKNIILSKYVLGYLCMTGAAVLFVAVKMILSASQHKTLGESLYVVMFAIVSGLLLIAINTPITFKFGTQKGRIVFIVFIGISAAVGSVMMDLMPSIPEKMISLLPAITVLSVLVLNVFSILVSFRIKHR